MNIIAFDLGGVFSNKHLPPPYIIENSFEVAAKLVKKFDDVYIVSRVNSEQRERALKWFVTTDFFNQTGIKESNVYFCFDRRDKALFVKALNINVFIDDRPDVLMEMKENEKKILFNPSEKDYKDYRDVIFDQNMIVVKNWLEVEKVLLYDKQCPVHTFVTMDKCGCDKL